MVNLFKHILNVFFNTKLLKLKATKYVKFGNREYQFVTIVEGHIKNGDDM